MTKRKVYKYKKSRQYGYNIWNIENRNLRIRKQRTINYKYYQFTFRFKEEKRFLSEFSANISKNQFKKIYYRAKNAKGIFLQNLLSLFQSRLDISLYRLGLVKSVFHARQVINHGLIRINGKTIKSTNYMLQTNDILDYSSFINEVSMYNITRRNKQLLRSFLIDLDLKSIIILNTYSNIKLNSNYYYRQEYLFNFLYK